jgi:hypothetical protein
MSFELDLEKRLIDLAKEGPYPTVSIEISRVQRMGCLSIDPTKAQGMIGLTITLANYPGDLTDLREVGGAIATLLFEHGLTGMDTTIQVFDSDRNEDGTPRIDPEEAFGKVN